MKRKIISLLLCIVCVVSLCFPVAADDDGYSAIISDIDKTCPTCGATLHASWGSTSGAEVELEISDTGKVKIPAGAGAFARIHLRCSSCGYEKTETRLLGLDFGAEKPGNYTLDKMDTTNAGANIPAAGGRNPKGYGDEGKANVTAQGVGCIWVEPFGISNEGGFKKTAPNSCVTGTSSSGTSFPWQYRVNPTYYFIAPITGLYYVGSFGSPYDFGTFSIFQNQKWYLHYLTASFSGTYAYSITLNKGEECYFSYQFYNGSAYYQGKPYRFYLNKIPIFIDPLSDSSITTTNNITINNNTWNGNIYTDNSTNLTYIYPEYTTINENNETVTNISNNPIIYNNETKQYYTYDQTTKNYYYITYNSDPAPSPTPTPAPTDKPGGSISTPETGKPGGSSGSSWWDKLLSKIGDAIIDGLLGAVSAVLKLIFKLLSTILSWIIWAVSRVFDLLPFLPPGLGGLLVGGVVVCFVIGIIKFIRG